MTLISSKSLTLPEFFSLTAPEGDITYELVDGEAIPKMSPKFFHSRLTLALSSILDRWNQGRGEVGIEWAIILSKNDRDWCPVPDLLYISLERLGDITLTDEACPVPPELLRSIDVECQLQNMNRQDWIKMVCVEKLRAIQSSRIANTV